MIFEVNMEKKQTTYDKLNTIAEIANDEDRRIAFRNALLSDNTLAIIVQRTYHPNYNFDLPKGPVPESARKSGHAEPGPFLQSLRKWDILRPAEEVPMNSNVKKYIKEQQFLGFYEGASNDDAELLVAVKDKVLPWPTLDAVFVANAVPELFPDSFRPENAAAITQTVNKEVNNPDTQVPDFVKQVADITTKSVVPAPKGNAKQQCVEIMQANPGLKRKDYLALFEAVGIKKATAAIYYQELKDTVNA